jgi:hypothetical protein
MKHALLEALQAGLWTAFGYSAAVTVRKFREAMRIMKGANKYCPLCKRFHR